MISLLLADDHQIVIDGLRGLLEGEDDIGELYEAKNGQETVRQVKENDIDLVLLDINMPDISGFEICKSLKQDPSCPKIIALTMHGNAGYINKMIKVGVDGYLLKNTGRDELLQAIKTVMKGEKYFSNEVKDSLIMGLQQERKPKTSDFLQKLTRREKEILRLITEELTTDQIASKLFISPTTVISHRKSLLRKLNAKNVAGMVKKAFEFGLLKEDS